MNNMKTDTFCQPRPFSMRGMSMFATPLLERQATNIDWLKWAAMVVLLVQMTVRGAEPIVQWATVAGGPGLDIPYGIALAPAGELHLVGDFEQELNGRWLRPTKVLYKFDLSGTLIGSQASRGEAIRAVAVDAQGNYYLTGYVWDSTTLGVGHTNDFYLAKYTSTGTLLWERTAGNSTYSKNYSWSQGNAIALDAAGHVYVAGESLGPDVFGDVTFPAAAAGPLLCKYDQDGTLLWAKRVKVQPDQFGRGGSAGSIALDANGDIVITGSASNGQANFGGIVITIDGPYGSYTFVAKYSATGEVQWAKAAHGGSGVAADKRGNVYCTGDAISADPAGLNGMHCSKFTRAGELVWDKTIHGAWPTSLALDGKDEPIFTAELVETVQLDDLSVQHSGTEGEILICKADATGEFKWALAGSGSSRGNASGVVCDRAGNAYVAGAIGCSVINGAWVCFEGMLSSSPLNMLFPGDAYSAKDVFVARLTDPDAVAVELSIARSASGLTLSWLASLTGFGLESATALPAVNWSAVPSASSLVGDQNVVTVELGGSSQFFRLRKP